VRECLGLETEWLGGWGPEQCVFSLNEFLVDRSSNICSG